MALMSAWMPAPPLPSNPAIVSTDGYRNVFVFILFNLCLLNYSFQLRCCPARLFGGADSGNHRYAISSRLHRGAGVIRVHPADRDQRLISKLPDLPESLQAPFGHRIRFGGCAEYRTDPEAVRRFRFCSVKLLQPLNRVTQQLAAGPPLPRFRGRHILLAHVDAKGTHTHGYLQSIIDDEWHTITVSDVFYPPGFGQEVRICAVLLAKLHNIHAAQDRLLGHPERIPAAAIRFGNNQV